MPQVTRTALVPYTPPELFVLVNDVEAYPQYLPFCVEARVLTQAAAEVTAHIAFARAGLRHGVTTRNRLQAPHRVEMELVEGPFDLLRGAWEFRPLGATASKVAFTLEYELSSRLMHLVAGFAAGEAAAMAMDAFQQRAVHLYGKRS